MNDKEAIECMKKLREYFGSKCTVGPDDGCNKCDMLNTKLRCYDAGYKTLSEIMEHMAANNNSEPDDLAAGE
jgi:hypothetical protein